MSRRLTLLLCLIVAVVAGCSRDPERGSAIAPTGPSAVAASSAAPATGAPGGISGPMALSFPGANETFLFRQDLDAKYQTGLGRPLSFTFVDREGEVVWTQEYIRYRLNGCDHPSAVQRVLAQIDGNAPGQTCGPEATGEIQFPSRADVFDFRRQLESKYQLMGRGLSSTYVDIEGAVIWIQEYLRYRLNGCDHATAVQKVISQIEGKGIAATCYVPPLPCNYRLTPGSRNVGGTGGTFEVEFFHVSGPTCTWSVASDQSWVTITPPTSGEGATRVQYRVAQNGASDSRTANIRFDWSGGSTNHIVFQSGSDLNVSITLTDTARSGTAATDSCHIKSPSTPCTLTASANIQGTSTFNWTVTYLYPNLITHTNFSNSNVFTFTQQCGGGSSTATGFDTTMTVTLIVTDPTAGTTQTVVQTFGIKLFTC
jgi:hypothetical protein